MPSVKCSIFCFVAYVFSNYALAGLWQSPNYKSQITEVEDVTLWLWFQLDLRSQIQLQPDLTHK